MGAAAGAKIVTTVVLGAFGAGVFAGVSHDGRGAEPVDTETVVVPTATTTLSTPPSTATSFTTTTSTTMIVAAQPATPDPAPSRARVRSGGS
jgi:hypothetical protein